MIAICASNTQDAIQQISEAIGTGQIDPEIETAVRASSYDTALERIDAAVSAGRPNAPALLSLASMVEMVKGNSSGAAAYARRAYELRPNDLQIMLGYHAALTLTGRGDEANHILDTAYRRRGQFGPHGSNVIETLVFFRRNNDTIANWYIAREECPGSTGTSESSEVARFPVANGSESTAFRSPEGCAIDASLRAQAAATGGEARRLYRQLAGTNAGSRMGTILRYQLLHYDLASSQILGDRRAEISIESEIQDFGQQIQLTQGPWVVLQAVIGTVNFDLLNSPSQIFNRYQLFDQALRDASTVPLDDAGDRSVQLFAGFNGIILGTYEITIGLMAILREDYEVTWARLESGTRRIRSSPVTDLGLTLRLQTILLMMEVADELDESTERADFILEEFRQLKDIIISSPRSNSMLGPQLSEAREEGCSMSFLPATECRR